MRLLVIEDEPDLAQALAKGLRRLGYAVDIAYDGLAGWELASVKEAFSPYACLFRLRLNRNFISLLVHSQQHNGKHILYADAEGGIKLCI
jgi:DNA-binding response OmpR family regulator